MDKRVVPDLDLDYVRSRFPALTDGWAYFDNAGGSQVLGTVIDRIANYMRTSPIQLGATYAKSELASRRQHEATEAIAELLNVRDPHEIVFGPSATALFGRLARALRPLLRAGDEVIVTNLDHEANIGAWRRLIEFGIRIREWKVRPETFNLHIDDLAALLTNRTRLVCFTQASNVVGSVMPVAEIARLAHEAGADVCVDGVACAAHRAVDVQASDIDYYVFSTYKVYGPHLGVLYGKHDKLLALANLNHEFFAADALPYKLQPGGAPYELVYGAGAIRDYYRDLGIQLGVPQQAALRDHLHAVESAFHAHENELTARLLDFLGGRPDIRIVGNTRAGEDRLPTVSFVVAGRDSATIPPRLDPQRVAVRYGHFYAKRLIDALGLAAQNGVVRVSMAHYNTISEVDRLIAGLESALT